MKTVLIVLPLHKLSYVMFMVLMCQETAREQYDFSARIRDADLKEGDLVFFQSGRSITHVGLYIGNNKFVNASTSSGVTISDLSDNYWNKKYAGAGRVQSSFTSSQTSK